MTGLRRGASLLIALGCLIAAPVHAAPPAVYTSLDRVHACQPLAKRGALLGTRGGLAWIDAAGQLKQRWTRMDGLPGTRVHALLLEGDDLWVGTDRGLARMRWAVASGKPALKLQVAVAAPPVRDIVRHDGQLYLGTWDGGVLRFDPRSRRLVALSYSIPAAGPTPAARKRVTSMTAFDGALHVGTAGAGLWRLAGGKLQPVPVSRRLPSPFVWSLARAGGRLFVGTLAGLTRLEGGVLTLLDQADTRALTMTRGGLLAGTYGQGVQRVSAGSRAETSARGGSLRLPAGARFVNTLRSSGGALCVGTRSGAWIARSGEAFSKIALPGPPSNDISALAVDPASGEIFVGTFDGGLSVLAGGRWRVIAGIDARIDALALRPAAPGQPSTLWVGTPRGLYRVRSGQVRRFGLVDGLRHQHVHSLAVLRRGGLLVGTGLGAVVVRGDRVEQIGGKQGLRVASVWAVAEDDQGAYWIGTSQGLYHWTPTTRRFERFSVAGGHLSDDWVTALEIAGGAVYVGTYNSGVCRLSRGADSAWASAKLGGGWINFAGLEIIGGALYASSMSGLRKLPLDGEGKKFDIVARAAPGRDVTGVAVTKGGALLIASRRGLARR